MRHQRLPPRFLLLLALALLAAAGRAEEAPAPAPAPTLESAPTPEPAPPPTADPAEEDHYLEQLARIQENNGELDLSQGNYEQVVQRIATREGEYSEHLIDPLIGLGRVHLEKGDYDAAEGSLRRAQHLSHRAEGVYTPRQLPIIDLMTRIDIARDDPLAADREQRFALYLGEHDFGNDSPELLPSLYKLADWYLSTGQFMNAYWVYDRAIKIVEAKFGEKDLRLVEALRGASRSLQLDGSTRTYEVLERARAILAENEKAHVEDYIGVLAELGDAYIVSQKMDEARAAYREAWTRMHDAGLTKTADVDFSQPALIELSRPLRSMTPFRKTFTLDDDPFVSGFGTGTSLREETPDEADLTATRPRTFTVTGKGEHYRYKLRDQGEQAPENPNDRIVIGKPIQFFLGPLQFLMPVGYQHVDKLAEMAITLQFTVDAEGDTTDAEVLESNAPRKLDQILKEALARLRFRPRIVGGETIATEHVQLTQEFK